MKDIIAIKNAFFYSISGLKYLLKERAFRQELLVLVILGSLECFRNTSLNMRLYMFTSYMLILLAEALNSAVEATVDRIGLEKNELSKKAKDIGSAAAFLMMVHFGIIWLLSFFF